MNTLITLGCLIGLFMVMAKRKRHEKPKPALMLLALVLGLASISSAMYSITHDDDSVLAKQLTAATCQVRIERSDFVANAVKDKLPALDKTIFLFNASERDDVVQAQSRCFLEKSGCPQNYSIEKLHPQPAIIALSELKSVISRHPGKVLFVSFCGLPSSNEDENAKQFWTQSSSARFLVCDAWYDEIDPTALENNLLLGWCLELFNGGRHLELIDKSNYTDIQANNPIAFSGDREIPAAAVGEIIEIK